jgi:hypothetical protein
MFQAVKGENRIDDLKDNDSNWRRARRGEALE